MGLSLDDLNPIHDLGSLANQGSTAGAQQQVNTSAQNAVNYQNQLAALQGANTSGPQLDQSQANAARAQSASR